MNTPTVSGFPEFADESSTATEKDGRYFRYLRLALFNLLLVALAGVLMRYKILASLPWLNQKYMMHGHSHFAFAGWVSLALMAGLAGQLHRKKLLNADFSITWILRLQVFSAYGMLLSFPFQGYGPLSIQFSSLSLFITWWFSVLVWWKIRGQKGAAFFSIRAALLFNVLSTLGTLWLVYLMVSGGGSRDMTVSALFTYLHFQYNGWFLFGCIALFLLLLPVQETWKMMLGMRMLVVAAIPAVLLSMLWLKLHPFLYGTAVVSAFVQVVGLLFFTGPLLIAWRALQPVVKKLWVLSWISLVLRTTLQMLSVVPALGKYGFAYRPVVIGYLHLMFIGCITLFLLGYLFHIKILDMTSRFKQAGILLFTSGFIITEVVLMLQGLLYMGWTVLPHTNLMLFAAALIMSAGLAFMQQWKKTSVEV
jgi:hypothetical protein